MLKKMVALVFLFAVADAQAISFNIFSFGKRKQIEQEQRTKLEAEVQRQQEQNQVNQLPLEATEVKNEAVVVEEVKEATEVVIEEEAENKMHKGIIPAGVAFIICYFLSTTTKQG